MFIIYDELHAEFISDEFDNINAAFSELQKLARIPFENEPNKPPCTSWRKCKRKYYIHEYDDSQMPWNLLAKAYALKVSASEVIWMFNDTTSIPWSSK
jgi:hypothetical protein